MPEGLWCVCILFSSFEKVDGFMKIWYEPYTICDHQEDRILIFYSDI
jgi:hypothetical protein